MSSLRRYRYSLLLVALLVAFSGGGTQVRVSAARSAPGLRDLVVAGTLVTMDDRLGVVPNGRVVIADGRILAVLRPGEPLPPQARGFPAVSVRGYVYPGLVNPHNHLAFGALPAWEVPDVHGRPLERAADWKRGPDHDAYLAAVLRPKRRLMERGLAAEVGKWAELKELAGGATTTQGSFGFQARSGKEDHRGFEGVLARDVDLDSWRLRESSAGIYDQAGRLNETLLSSALADVETSSDGVFLVHLSEGRSEAARRELQALNGFRRRPGEACGPLTGHTTVIHGTAYGPREFALMARCEADLVASSLGNLLFYGVAPDLSLAAAAGVNVSLGSDWTPVGSRNLLEELKVVDFINTHLYARKLSDGALVEMVTRNPAAALGWRYRVGRLAPRYLGDLLVLRTASPNPYRALIEATERDVALTVVGGDPVYGDSDLMATLKPYDREVVDSGCGFRKAFDVTTAEKGVERGAQELGQLERSLRRGFRNGSPSPLFTCADRQHFRALAESRNLAYFHPELRGLPAYLRRLYGVR